MPQIEFDPVIEFLEDREIERLDLAGIESRQGSGGIGECYGIYVEIGRFKVEALDFPSWIDTYNFLKKNAHEDQQCERYPTNKLCIFLRASMDFSAAYEVTGDRIMLSNEQLKQFFQTRIT